MIELEGRSITGPVLISSDKQTLVFQTSLGNLTYRTDGDCCTYCWFAEINGLDNVLGKFVTKVEERKMTSSARGSCDVVDIMGYLITFSDFDRADIIFRAEHNGYYGGWCELSKYDYHTKELKPITEKYWSGA